MKTCVKCLKAVPLSEFPKAAGNRDGLRNDCKPCNRLAAKESGSRRYRTESYRTVHAQRIRERRAAGAVREADVRSREKRKQTPEKTAARLAVFKAVANGSLVRPTKCGRCETTPSPRASGAASIQAHHVDYSRPLDVLWLCQPCHAQQHHDESRALAEKEGAE